MINEKNLKIIKVDNNYFIDHKKYKKKYPYFKYFINKKDINILFNSIKNYKLKILSEKELLDYKIYNNILHYENKKIVFNELFEENFYINKLTDYFSEKCRVKCQFANHKIPYENYMKNRDNILKVFYYKYGYINNKILDDYYYKNRMFMCSNFKISVMISILKLFKPTNMLDFSAGWGDRLIGAIAYGTKYTGVDPSKCLKNKYQKIIETLSDNTNNYKIINEPFEEVNLGDNIYDFVFTSPPFFTYENYEKDNEKQSIKKFNTLELWREKFLFPSLEKSIKHLKINKYLALYIDNFKGYEYIKDMLNFMEKKNNIKYSGNIYFFNSDTNKKLRTIYVWRKLDIF